MAEDKGQNTVSTTKEDVDKNKTMAILAYFIFFLPLLTDSKDSKFAKFHANQALVVWLLYFACGFVATITLGLGSVALLLPFVLWVMGLMNASNGQMKRLPLIGGIDIIK